MKKGAAKYTATPNWISNYDGYSLSLNLKANYNTSYNKYETIS